MMRKIIIFAVFLLYVPALIGLWAGTALSAEYEFDWDEGLHQEEWYDPTDWFDSDDRVEYETDWYDKTYGYSDPFDDIEEPEAPGFENLPDTDGGFEFGAGYEYYTRDWYKGGKAFEKWYRENDNP